MDTFLRNVDRIMRQDPGGRGLLSALPENPVFELADELRTFRKVFLLTGFPVRLTDGKAVCETDGPLGIVDIAVALSRLQIPYLILSDEESSGILRAGMRSRDLPDAVHLLCHTDPAGDILRLLAAHAPSHVLTLERPGKAADGHYHNMRGAVIDDLITDTSMFLSLARENGIRSVSVGDGGNESGMGALRGLIHSSIPLGSLICADDTADIPLVSGVSNWWGDGICAVLSKETGLDLLPSEEELGKTLEAVVRAGSVDGVTKEARNTVDGLPEEVHRKIISDLRALL